jgi:Transposase IS66 family
MIFRIVQAPAETRPIAHGMAGPSLLAHVLVSKYANHLPLYRQSEIYARQGVDLERFTPSGWVGAMHELLSPLVEAMRRYVFGCGKLHADDTPVCRCWRRGRERPRPGACGPVFAMTGPAGPRIHRRHWRALRD